MWRGIVYVIENGLRWVDAPSAHGPAKTLWNRLSRWPDNGIFALIFSEVAQSDGQGAEVPRLDAIDVKAPRPVSSLKQGEVGLD